MDIQLPLPSAPTGPASPLGKGGVGGDLTGSFQIPEIWLLIWAQQGSQCPRLVSVEISPFVPAHAGDPRPPPQPAAVGIRKVVMTKTKELVAPLPLANTAGDICGFYTTLL